MFTGPQVKVQKIFPEAICRSPSSILQFFFYLEMLVSFRNASWGIEPATSPNLWINLVSPVKSYSSAISKDLSVCEK